MLEQMLLTFPPGECMFKLLIQFLNKNTTLFSDVILHYTPGEFSSSPILYTSCSGAHWEGKLSFTENANPGSKNPGDSSLLYLF